MASFVQEFTRCVLCPLSPLRFVTRFALPSPVRPSGPSPFYRPSSPWKTASATEAVEEVAESTGSTINDVWAVASFYTNFRFVPPGRHVVEVCWGPSCHLRGAHDLLNEVQMALGLSQEGDTPDGRVTLKYNTCLGACAQAPVMAVDHRTLGRVTQEQARSIESRLQPRV